MTNPLFHLSNHPLSIPSYITKKESVNYFFYCYCGYAMPPKNRTILHNSSTSNESHFQCRFVAVFVMRSIAFTHNQLSVIERWKPATKQFTITLSSSSSFLLVSISAKTNKKNVVIKFLRWSVTNLKVDVLEVVHLEN